MNRRGFLKFLAAIPVIRHIPLPAKLYGDVVTSGKGMVSPYQWYGRGGGGGGGGASGGFSLVIIQENTTVKATSSYDFVSCVRNGEYFTQCGRMIGKFEVTLASKREAFGAMANGTTVCKECIAVLPDHETTHR